LLALVVLVSTLSAACQLRPGAAQTELSQTAQPIETHPAGTVTGRMYMGRGAISHEGASNSAGVANRHVELDDPSSGAAVGSATTADDGSFRISAPAGTYVLKSGTVKRYVQITAGQESHADIVVPVP
jgi:hypothetical protein